MSISQLEVAGVPSGDGALSTWLDDVQTVLARGAGVDLESVADSGLVDGVRRVQGLVARLDAVKLAMVAAVDHRQAARKTTGATSTAAWLKAEGVTASQASRDVALAQSLVGNTATREALASGRISAGQAEAITTALDGLSEQVDAGAKAAAEARLLERAPGTDPWRLRKDAAAQAARIDPAAEQRMAAGEQAAKARRDLTIFQGSDRMWHLRGLLDTEGAAHLLNALDPLSKPAPSSAHGRDTRSPGRRRADALVGLARLAAKTGQLPHSGGDTPTVIITIDHTVLTGASDGCALISAATLTEPVSVAAARRWACDAQILPAVLGSAGQVLDLGRATRTANPTQRKALALRDKGCAFPGCDRPPGWTDAHHIVHWADGGPTDLDNLVLLCGTHHDLTHHHDWTITLGPDRLPVFEPPHPPPEPPPEPPW